MIFHWCIIATILCFHKHIVPLVNGHARDMLTSCTLSLSPGIYMMGKTSILSTSKYLNVVNETQHKLVDNDFYTPNEILSISLSSVGGSQYVMETSNAAAAFGLIIDGVLTTTSRYIGCSNRRVYDQPTVQLLTPHAGSGDVSVWVGWASGVGVVEVSSKITLKERLIVGGSHNPTLSPATVGTSSNTSTTSASHDAAIGVSFAIIALIILGCFVLYSYKRHEGKYDAGSRLLTSSSSSSSSSTLAYASSSPPLSSNNYLTYEKKSYFLIFIIVGLCITFILLMSAWTVPTKDINGNDGYLGTPDWSNKISLHPSILVNGFLFMQVAAILSWSMIVQNKSFAKFLHVICQFVALITMMIGVTAIVRDKQENNEVSLTSLHSWLGVCTITLFCFNFLIGCFMGILKQYYPNSSLRTIIEWLFIHRTSGLVTLGFTVITIVTGITDILSESTCASTNIESTQSNYTELPTACKLANGVGITVVLTAGAVCLLVLNRSYETQRVAALTQTHTRVGISKEEDDNSNRIYNGGNHSHEHTMISMSRDAYYETDTSNKSYNDDKITNSVGGLDYNDTNATAVVSSPLRVKNRRNQDDDDTNSDAEVVVIL